MLTADDIDLLPRMAENIEDKKDALYKISAKLYEIITNPGRHQLLPYIIRTCNNTISLCMNATINSNSNFENIFVNYFKLLAPDFHLNELFIRSANESGLYFVEPSH